MTTQTKRRIIGGVAATFITIGLFWGYQKYAKASRLNELNRLSAAASRGTAREERRTHEEVPGPDGEAHPRRAHGLLREGWRMEKRWMTGSTSTSRRPRRSGRPGSTRCPRIDGASVALRGKARGRPRRGRRRPRKGRLWRRGRRGARKGRVSRGTAWRRPWWSWRWRRLGGVAEAVAGEALRSSVPSGVASGSTRRAPSNAPSVRNSPRPCAADEAEAEVDSGGGFGRGR